MKTWGKWLIGIVTFFPMFVRAQSFTETALMFSRIKPGGSARMQAMGGAQTSLGGDYSSAFSNPAGLGMFNRSEFSISPGFHLASIGADYRDKSLSTSKTNLHLPGFGLVFQTDKNKSKGFLSGTFAISFNRTNNFNQRFDYEGNSNNSIIDYFLEEATGFTPNQFNDNGDLHNTVTWLGYNNYLIGEATILDPNNDPTRYFSDVEGNPFQAESIQTKGAQNQWSFSYGANFTDKVFVGGGIGFTSVRYQSQKNFREEFNREPLDNLVLEENLRINGSGFNATLGLIFRPLESLQVGISYATPTLYKLTDTFNANLNTLWNDFDYFGDGSRILSNVGEETDDVISEYDLRTPSRLNLGASFFIQKYGFISADVEMVNYSGTKYSSGISGIDFTEDNKDIRSLYQTTINYRLGGEFRYNNYRARAGFAYMPDPFKSEQNGVSRQLTSLSGGVGYRSKDFYIDLAIVYTQGNNSYRPYRINTNESPLVNLSNQTTFGMVSLGFPF